MQVVVKGKNLDVPERIKRDAVAKLSKVGLFDRFIDMEVVFSEDRNPRIAEPVHCEVVLHAPRGQYLRAQATGPDHATAIDRAQDKLVRQARKLKTKRNHRRREVPEVADAATLVGALGENEG